MSFADITKSHCEPHFHPDCILGWLLCCSPLLDFPWGPSWEGRKGRAAHSHPSPSPSGVVLQLRAWGGWRWYLEAFPDTNPRFFPATEDYGHYEELPGEPGEHLFPEHPLEPDSFSEAGPPGRPKLGAGVPDFLPSAQRALYLRIQQKQQEEEERARRLAESSKQDRENEEGMCPPQGQGLSLTGTGTPHHCAGDRWGTPRSGFAPERSLWPGRIPAQG